MSLAPEALRLVQSFASTLGADDGADLLRTREDAATWLRAAALLDAAAGLSNSEHAALLRLRESLRDVLAAHTDGHQDATAAERLSRALADGRIIVTVNPASAIRLASAARASYSGLVAIVAVAIADSAAAGTWLRLKSCSVAGCGAAFYDDSAAATATRCAAHAAGA
ncbi:MAG TPA: ABATE domain-containing protein [Trebonia sp.]|nr:ABATE domain-containing protein [Trebonia sp.]